jgi:hypothetical protein
MQKPQDCGLGVEPWRPTACSLQLVGRIDAVEK